MILAFVVLASRSADAEILIRWDLASIPSPQALGISTIVIPAAQAQGIKQALAQGYRVYVEIDAAAAASFSPIEGTAGVIVNGPIASDVRERLAQRAKIVRLAENRGKWPHIRTNWVTRNKDVLQVTNRSSQPWLENNEALIRIATAASPPGAPPVLLTYAWQPVTVADLDQGPRLENYLVAIAEAGSFGADLLLPLHERFERELMAGSPDARADWEEIRRFVDFYAWNVPAQHRPMANVGVVTSDPMRSFEMLNLLARHNLPFVTIVPAAVTAQTLAGLDLVVLLDEPTGGGRAAAAAFAEQGGAVVDGQGRAVRPEHLRARNAPAARLRAPGGRHLERHHGPGRAYSPRRPATDGAHRRELRRAAAADTAARAGDVLRGAVRSPGPAGRPAVRSKAGTAGPSSCCRRLSVGGRVFLTRVP